MNKQFDMDACYEAIEFEVKTLGHDPIRMLGQFIIRAEQDVFFNKTMIEAMKKYIKDNEIKWNA